MAGELPDDVKATLSILDQPQPTTPAKLKPTRTMDDIALPIRAPRADDVQQTLSILDGDTPPETNSEPNQRDVEADVLKLALRKGVKSNTALAAHRKNVARKLNINPALVTTQAEESAFYQDHDPTDLQKNYPALAKYLQVDGNAELVGKNIDPLKEVETFYRRAVQDPEIMLSKGVVAAASTIVGLGDLVSLGKAGKYVEDQGIDFKKIQSVLTDLYTPEAQAALKKVAEAKGFTGTLAAAAQNPSAVGLMIGESLPQMYLGRVFGGALKAAFPSISFGTAGAAGEGITMAGGSAEQIRRETDTGELTAGQTALSVGVGVIGTGLSKFGNVLATKLGIEDVDAAMVAGKLLTRLEDSGVPKQLAVRLIGGAAVEGGVEEMPQSITEQIAQNVALGRPWDEGVPENAAIGLVTGGAMGAAAQVGAVKGKVPTTTEETPAEKQARATVQNSILRTAAAVNAEEQRNALKEWGKRVSADNPLRRESPQSFKEFVRTMADENGAIKEVFVDAKLLNETLGQAGIDKDKLAAEMPEVAESLNEALVMNGEVRIPIEDYATHIVGTPVESAIIDHLRTAPDGMTYAESQVFFQQQQDDFIKQAEALVNLNEPVLTRKEFAAQAPDGVQYKDYLAAHKNKVEAFATDLQEVHDKLLAGLESTGRFPRSISKVYAIPFREFYATNAARMGMLPSELYASLPLNFEQMSAGDILNQKAFHGSPHSFNKFSTKNIGIGEGAQAYGHGLYFTDTKTVAEHYRQAHKSNKLVFADGTDLKEASNGTEEKFAQTLLKANSGDYAKSLAENKVGENASTGDKRFAKAVEKILKDYKKKGVKAVSLSGGIYEVELAPKDDEYLLWDKPLGEQSEKVKVALGTITPTGELNPDGLDMGGAVIRDNRERQASPDSVHPWVLATSDGKMFGLSQKDVDRMLADNGEKATGENIYTRLTALKGSQKAASDYLHSIGIRGIKYLDGTSRSKGEGSYNYVIFSDADVAIKQVYGQSAKIPPTVNVDGVERPTTNSEGKLIHPTEEGIRNFWKWFGDSKVVDDQGRPLVVYHGTAADFTEFSADFMYTGEGASQSGSGFYFTTDRESSSNYALMAQEKRNGTGGSVSPVYLALRKPISIDFMKGEVSGAGINLTRARVRKIIMAAPGIKEADGPLSNYGDVEYEGFNRVLNEAVDQYAGGNNIAALRNDFYGDDHGAWLRALKVATGFDSAKSVTPAGATHFIAWNPNQIKSAIGNNGDFSASPNILEQSAFYSALQREIPSISKIADKNGMVKADQALSWVEARQKEGKFKLEEVEAVGLKDWLQAMEGKVSVADIENFVAENGVQIEEIILGDNVNIIATQEYEDQPEIYTLYRADDPEGQSYGSLGEIIRIPDGQYEINVPGFTGRVTFDTLQEALDRVGRGSAQFSETKFEAYKLPGGENYRELLLTLPKTDGQDFKSAHYDEKNILAHVRFDDRTNPTTGQKILFIEEIQSDWAQEGRKKGFIRPLTPDEKRLQTLNKKSFTDEGLSKEEEKIADDLRSRGVGDSLMSAVKGTPAAPFVQNTKSWVALAVKRMLRYAAENGYDQIAWTTGEQQAARYDLSMQISEASAISNGNGTYNLVLIDKADNEIPPYSSSGKKLTAKEMEDVIGKELTDRLVKGADASKDKPWPKNVNINPAFYTLRGLDLKVGGEGMLAFYDKLLPQVVSDVAKKLGGGKVGALNVGQPKEQSAAFFVEWAEKRHPSKPRSELYSIWGRGEAEPLVREYLKTFDESMQPALEITPEMREKIMSGLPLFQGQRAGFDPSTFTISLLKGADLSSVLHEGAHFYLEALADLAGRDTAPKQIKDDFRTTLEWFGITGDEAGVPGGATLSQVVKLPETVNVDGVERPATNSEGRPIYPTEEGIRNFWKWFGDSKVVDGQGRPLVVYHGTTYDNIHEFMPNGGDVGLSKETLNKFLNAVKNNTPFGLMNFRSGSFFSPDPKYAGNYTRENTGLIYPAYIKSVNPGYFQQDRNIEPRWSGFDADKTPDSLIFKEGNKVNEIAVIDPTQIKSAIGNNGDFSVSPNILEQSGRAGGTTLSQVVKLPETVNVDGVERPATNSEGRPIYPTEEGIRNFWKWFGNDENVDAEGRPKILYHSTLADINTFKPHGKFMGYSGTSGVSLTDNKEMASRYLDRYAEYGYVNGVPNQPFSKNIMPVYVKIGKFIERNTPFKSNIRFGWPLPEGYIPVHVKMGYDTLIRDDSISRKGATVRHSNAKNALRGKEYIVSNPNQIKSAIGNNGDFSVSPNILEQGGETPPPGQLPPGRTPEEIWRSMTLDQKRPYHEQWAQSYERYTLEGKAPTVEMQSVFSRFREWMLSVYKSMKDFLAQNPLAGKLNDDIRGVFDRLIASEDKIYQAEEARGYAALFGSAAEAGLSEKEFEDYQNLGKLASTRAVDEMNARSIRDMRWLSNAKDKAIKKLQAEANTKRAAIKAQVSDEVDAMPLNRARNFLTKGEFIDESGVRRESETKFKLNEAEVKAVSNGQVPDNIKGMIAPDGIGLELAAKLLGYQSPETLIGDLTNGESRDVTIQGLTDQRMLEQYGDLTDDKAIERAAEKAIHNDARARFMATGLKILSKTELSAAQLNRAAKMAAEATIAKKKIRALTPGQFTRAEAKANREAIENVARDPQKAVDAQRAALLNNRLAKAALEATEDVDSILKYFKKFDSQGVRKAIGIDQADQIDDLLQSVDRDKSTPLREIDKRQALADWVAEQEADGFEPVLDPILAEQIKTKHYKDMTVDELRMLRDTVKQIEHVGRLKQTLLTEMGRADFRARVEEAENSIRDNANRTVEERGTPTDVAGLTGQWVRQMFASHRKFSSFIREMDGGRDGGVMWRLLSKNMNAAGDSEVEMRRASSEALSGLFKGFTQDKTPLNLYAKRMRIPGTDIAMTQEQRIMFGMNWGNEGNRQRALDGGITGKRALSINDANAILDTLTKPEWDFVQGVWDHIATYKDQIAALERKITGIEPEWVEPVEIKTKHGTYRGGYFPAKYDIELSSRSESLEAAVDMRMGMKGAFNTAATRSGYTKARSEAVMNRPLLLSYNVIANHISEVTHRLAWQPWLIDANRVLKALDAPIREHYGAEVLREMRNTVIDIAAGDVGARTPMERAINHLRTGSTIVGMGWRFSTAFLQPSGLAQSWARIGGRWMTKGIAETFKNLNSASELVNSKSSLMKNRDITMNREVRDVLDRIRTTEGINAVTGSYFSLIGKMQRVVDIPTWLGAYEKALHDMQYEHAVDSEQRAQIESDAVAMADQAVIDSQSGGQIKDLASIQRGHPGLKLFTNFYSYFSATYNLNIEALRRTNFRSPTDVALLAGDLVLLNIIPVLFATALKEMTKGKCGDDLDCLVKSYGYEQAGYMFGQMVLLRDMGSAALVAAGGDQYGYSGPAGLRFFSDLYKAGVQANQGELDWPLFKSVSNTAGVLLHFPVGQVNTTLEGIMAVENGDVEGVSILPALLFGPPKEGK